VFKRGKDTEWDANCGMEEIREFCFKEFAVACLFWNFFVLYYSNNITYQSKERYAYCGSPIKTLRCTCEVGFGRIKDMKMMLDKKKIVRIN